MSTTTPAALRLSRATFALRTLAAGTVVSIRGEFSRVATRPAGDVVRLQPLANRWIGDGSDKGRFVLEPDGAARVMPERILHSLLGMGLARREVLPAAQVAS